MRIIFWGTPQYAVQSLKELIISEHQVIAVVTQPDKKRSRGNKLIPSEIKQLSLNHGIPVLTPNKIKNNDNFINTLNKYKFDIFIVVAYGKILTKEILEMPKYGSWNAHASLLPKWRGAAPIQWALLEGDNYTGVGIMRMNEGLDTGDILEEKRIKIECNENLISLKAKLSKLSSELIISSLLKIEQKVVEVTPQDDLNREIKYARILKKSDYYLNFNESALNIFRKINGLYPNAFLTYKNKNLKITELKILDSNSDLYEKFVNNECKNKAGRIIGIHKNLGIIVSTKTNAVIILEGKLEGKKTTKGNSLIQQLNPIVGEIL